MYHISDRLARRFSYECEIRAHWRRRWYV